MTDAIEGKKYVYIVFETFKKLYSKSVNHISNHAQIAVIMNGVNITNLVSFTFSIIASFVSDTIKTTLNKSCNSYR